MKAWGFTKSSRLLTPKDYAQVFDQVQLRVPHRNFLILARTNNQGYARLGLVFSKRNLKHAVQRNRIKRHVRETFRLCDRLPAVDIVVLGRRGLADIDNDVLSLVLNDLWSRLERKHHYFVSTTTNENLKSSGEKG